MSKYIIKYDDGAYNYGPGLMNGFPTTRGGATEYTFEEAQDKAKDLGDVTIEEVSDDD